MAARPQLVLLLLAAMLTPAASAHQDQVPAPTAAAEAKPLPDLAGLLKRAREHADQWQELRKSYTCKQVVVADELDSKGNKKGTHTDEYQVFFVEKTEVQQHMARDGKPLPDADAKKEQERVNKRVADIKAHNIKERKGGIEIRVSSLLKVAKISDPRREQVNGRPTIFFDYNGNPDAKADGLPEEIMKKLYGTVEIDEEDAAIVRLTGTLGENFHMFGGMLVNVKKGSHFELESTRVNNEVWFTKTVVGHVDGRLLLFKGFDGDMHASFSDYRKMKTSATILPGSQVIGEDGKPIPNLEAEPETPPQPPPAAPPKP